MEYILVALLFIGCLMLFFRKSPISINITVNHSLTGQAITPTGRLITQEEIDKEAEANKKNASTVDAILSELNDIMYDQNEKEV